MQNKKGSFAGTENARNSNYAQKKKKISMIQKTPRGILARVYDLNQDSNRHTDSLRIKSLSSKGLRQKNICAMQDISFRKILKRIRSALDHMRLLWKEISHANNWHCSVHCSRIHFFRVSLTVSLCSPHANSKRAIRAVPIITFLPTRKVNISLSW